MSKAATAGKLSTLDYILAAVDSGQRHSDFGIVFHLTTAQSLECLRAGARSARNRYPVSGSAIQARHWIPIDVPADGITSIASSAEMMTAAEQFMNCRLDLRKEAPIKQLLVTDAQNGKSMLVTHVHHAAADGFSAALWLHHQFRIAAGLEPSVLKSSPFQSVSLRGHSSSVDSHRSEPSQCLWTESTQATGLRRWFTLELPVRQLDMRCLESGVSRSDVLAAAAFETLAKWNRRHGASQRIGLWLPVNIRQRHSSQFGNGTSRIRIHPDSSRTDATFVDRCREIRRLIRCGLRGGDWAVPEYPPYARVPFWFSGPLLNAYLNRPNLDMGTIAFSYVENWSGCEDTVFQDAERIECIGQLHERHALAINAIGGNSTAGSVWVTFTYDPGRLTQDSVRQMADSFRDQIVGEIGAKCEAKCEKRKEIGTRSPVERILVSALNDGVRRLIGVFIGWLGLVLEAFHRIQIVTWSYNQKRLRLRYKITADTPIRNYDADLEQHIRAVAARYRDAGSDTRYAQTSGSTAAPKRILYTKSRLRSVRWMFTDMFTRSFRAYHVARKSLYVFSSFENDQSLTSMLREERRLPSYLVTLQAPYRIERNPAIQELAARYGEVAVRLWILVLSNPGVLYCTNPSTLWLFLRDVAENWQQSTQLIRDFQSGPSLFGAAVLHVARRLESVGSAERLRRIASTDEPLPFAASVPGVQAYMCWTGGYVKPFLDRIEKFLSPDRYRRIPLTSMSTETIETIGHYDCNSTTFLPMAKSVFYEFIEEGAQDRPENLKTATELRPMTAYTLVVSDSFGLRRYQTEDVFLCKGYSGKLPDLRFLRRRNLEYSFTGEKLSAEHLNQAFARLRNEFAELTPDVFLTCVPSLTQGDLLPHYKLVLVGTFDESSNVAVQIGEALAARCDTLLQEVNAEYRCKRHSGRLEMMRFEHLSFDDFITCFGAETQFKFLPLYRRTWEELLRQPAGVLCV